MYIGKLGDGSSPDDGIYVLLKEVIDNCIDEHTMGMVAISILPLRVSQSPYGIMDVVSLWVKW
jgi:topoisomerase-4 subunit B